MQILKLELSQEDRDEIKEIKQEILDLKKNYTPRNPEVYVTREETADKFKVNLSTLWGWTKKGILKSYGIGGRVYYKLSEIEQALQPLES